MADAKQTRGGYDPALFGTPIYRSWSNMKARCHNPRATGYYRYGARGIAVCAEWQSFAGFLHDMGSTFAPGLTLDRIDNERGYSKENCRWSDATQQANNRMSNKHIQIGGETKTLEQWIRASGLKSSTVRQRIYCYGWPVERALDCGGVSSLT